MIENLHLIYEIIVWIFLLYSAFIFIIYCWVGIYAFGALKRYGSENQHTDYNLIATNSNTPSFSVIAPAYNEGMTIVDNVRSLLSLYYPNLEIIIVNDGSKDDSIEKLIEAYDLKGIAYHVEEVISTKSIRGVYKSENRAFRRLTVVDKVNGGKADALNVGINISKGQYIVCIDVDCILEQDALLKLAKPFLEQTEERLIACGGVIRLANNCRVENGKVVDVNLPKTWIGRFQALEYIRAFVLGRMAWSRASGLILISGAFGAFDKEIVLACGGYDSNTVGEDMELVVRMRRYMEDQNEKYKVINIPDPLCWTEVPESKAILKKQRNRWMRGTIEMLWKHRKLMFNPKYGKLGMVSLPYWFFFELLGSVVEFTGYCLLIIFLLLGIINWPFFFVLVSLVLASGILYSIYAILVDLLTDQVYTKRKDLSTLLLTAVLEPFFFHSTVVIAGVSGVRDYFKKQHGWGEMTRQGFQHSELKESFWKKNIDIITWGLKSYAPIGCVFLSLYMLSVGVEIWWYQQYLEIDVLPSTIGQLLLENTFFAFQLLTIVGLLYLILHYMNSFWSKLLACTVFAFVVTFQFVLFLYFVQSNNLLGADLFYYSTAEVNQILETSGVINIGNVSLLILVSSLCLIPLILASRKAWYIYPSVIMVLLGIIAFIVPEHKLSPEFKSSALLQSASVSKWNYFLKSNIDDYLANSSFANINFFNTEIKEVKSDYPFMRQEETQDVLGAYMQKSPSIPNLVIIVVEGLGHAYSSPKGYIGNFTPFIDSLKSHSLYWENNLSSSGRTFSVLPTILGSLPFAAHGFLEQEQFPLHFNLWNIFKHNNFTTSFFYGGDASFDYMSKYAESSLVDNIIDFKSFETTYNKLPSSGGESWGYEDQAVFDKMLNGLGAINKPYFNVVLTLSSHSPFLINRNAYYEKLVETQIERLNLNGKQKETALSYKKELASIMNTDEALQNFFAEYKTNPDYENTIFIITGDHSMPEIALQNKIDRYHVPLLVYSPLLTKTSTFRHTVSHFDVAPSIIAYYRNNYAIQTPSQVTWLGLGLHEGASRASGGIPIMQSKYQLEDYILSPYYLNRGSMYKLDGHLNEDVYKDEKIDTEIKKRFDIFNNKNKQLIEHKKLIPDSIYHSFFGSDKNLD
ncbi:sulfatase-like hydrolase/transferase [Sphingobacterium bovistauri]|uniref:Sulfatase-like hydrolase/transferase n=1 Tax=Sphingobacterium bovistauri TaxID=2781959 RepID=A0ABS7Z6K8_9SPHI|nr:sulfatase-like hydrolase/transferase [Sphingobacterium bovistauri]MCA5005795.1 sulfatase-like hydrolase/transferase [Sphingobacterium bovistauri]